MYGRRWLRGTIAAAAWAAGLFTLSRKTVARGGKFALELHGVAAHDHRELPRRLRPHMTRARLKCLIEWLLERNAVLAPAEFLSTPKAGVLLTFDDGLANNVEVALPVLEEYSCPAIFFVSTQHVMQPTNWLACNESVARESWGDRAAMPPSIGHELFDGMSRAQLAMAAAHPLVTLGSHTVSHPRLTTLGDDALHAELALSKAFLEQETGRDVDLFAYPYGDADERVAAAVAASGFRAAFVEGRRRIADARFNIPRVGLYGSEPWYLAAKLSGLETRPLRGRILESGHA